MVRCKFKMIWALCLAMILSFQHMSYISTVSAEEKVYNIFSWSVPGMAVSSTDDRLQDESIQLQGSSVQEGDELENLLVEMDMRGVLWDAQLVDGEGDVLNDVENMRIQIHVLIPDTLKKYVKLFYVKEDGSKQEIELEVVRDESQVFYILSTVENVDSLGKFLVAYPFDYGDVTGDLEITSEDALEILKTAVKIKTLSEPLIPLADVDADNEVTAQDALWILKHVVKKIKSFPVDTTNFRVSEDKLVWAIEPREGFEVIGKSYINSGQMMDDTYYMAQKDGKYGLIDTMGSWIVEPKFATIMSGNGGYFFSYEEGEVTAESEGYTLSENKELVAINAKNVFTETEKKSNCYFYDVDNARFVKVKAGGMIVEEVDCRFTGTIGVRGCHLEPLSEGSSEMMVVLDKVCKYALATDGELKTNFIFDDVGESSEGCIPVKINGKWGYQDEDGYIVPLKCQAICSNAANGKTENLNLGEKVFPADFTEGYVVVFDGSHYALFNQLSHNNEILHYGLFEDLTEVKDGKLWAKKDGKWGVLDLEATLKLNNH